MSVSVSVCACVYAKGEPGQNSTDGPFGSTEIAEKAFKKKFQDKTRNKWENRDDFAPVPGKYTLLEMEDDEDDDQARFNK